MLRLKEERYRTDNSNIPVDDIIAYRTRLATARRSRRCAEFDYDSEYGPLTGLQMKDVHRCPFRRT